MSSRNNETADAVDVVIIALDTLGREALDQHPELISKPSAS